VQRRRRFPGLFVVALLLVSCLPVGFAEPWHEGIPLYSERGLDGGSPSPVLIASNGSPSIVFSETADYVRLNFTLFVVDFYKNTFGYNVIHFQNGSVLVYNERFYLEYSQGQNWKPIGTAYSLSYVKINDYAYNVTRFYTDYLGTTFNVTYLIRSFSSIKNEIRVHVAQSNVYRLRWEENGITFPNYSLEGNGLNFWEEDSYIRFDWSDVYEAFGDITSWAVGSVAQGRKLDIMFSLGSLMAGSNLIIDPIIDGFNSATQLTKYIEALHPSSTSSKSAVGQSFSPSVDCKLTSVKFRLSKSNSPTGTAYVKLYSHSGTFGTSSVPNTLLATSDSYNVASLPTAGTWIEFTFSGSEQYELAAGEYYCLDFGEVASGTLDTTNRIRFIVSSTVYLGNCFVYASSSWAADATSDALFYVYGTISGDYQPITDISNVDSSADIGTHSLFDYQRSKDANYDTLTEANTVTTSRDIYCGFENSWTNGGGTWTQSNWGFDASTKLVGSYSANKAASSSAGNLVSPALDTSAATAVHISFRWQDDDCDAASDMYLQFYDNLGNWDTILDLGALEDDVWLYYSLDTLDSQYLHDDFQIRFLGGALASTENFWVDEAVITKVTNLFTADMESYLPTGWSENPNPNAWAQDNSQKYGGTYSAGYEYAASMVTGSLVAATKDLSGYTYAYVTFWVYDDDCDANELTLQFYDNLGNWNTIMDLATGIGNEDVWHNIYIEITDTQYLHANFAYRFTGNAIASGENCYIDNALLSGVATLAANYKLDLEFQFTNVNSTRANEELCIYTGAFSGEDLKLNYWDGDSWELLDAAMTASSWNNYTVSLTSATFTIQMIDTTLTSDTVQSTWQIDCTLLHTWEGGANTPPVNDACDSTATFDYNVLGWINMTVTDVDLVANLYTVQITITTSDSKTSVYLWTQSTGVFSETSDPNGISSESGSVRVNIDADTDKIAFKIKFTQVPALGNCNVQAVTTDDATASDTDTYTAEFRLIHGYMTTTVTSTIAISSTRLWKASRTSSVTGTIGLTSARVWIAQRTSEITGTVSLSTIREWIAKRASAINPAVAISSVRQALHEATSAITATVSLATSRFWEAYRSSAVTITVALSVAFNRVFNIASTISITVSVVTDKLWEQFRASTVNVAVSVSSSPIFTALRSSAVSITASVSTTIQRLVNAATSVTVNIGLASAATNIFSRLSAIAPQVSLSSAANALHFIASQINPLVQVSSISNAIHYIVNTITATVGVASSNIYNAVRSSAVTITTSLSTTYNRFLHLETEITITISLVSSRIMDIFRSSLITVTVSLSSSLGKVTNIASTITIMVSVATGRLWNQIRSSAISIVVGITSGSYLMALRDSTISISVTASTLIQRLVNAATSITVNVGLSSSRLLIAIRDSTATITVEIQNTIQRAINAATQVTVTVGLTTARMWLAIRDSAITASITISSILGRVINVASTLTVSVSVATSQLLSATRESIITVTTSLSTLTQRLLSASTSVTVTISLASARLWEAIRSSAVSITVSVNTLISSLIQRFTDISIIVGLTTNSLSQFFRSITVNPAVAVSTLIGRLISAATSVTINISVATSNLYQAIRNTAATISVAISTAIATGIHTFSVATSVTVNIVITTIRGFYTENPILAPGGIPLIAIIVFGLMIFIALSLMKRR